MKMEQTECSETLAFKLQTPVNHPEESLVSVYHPAIRWKMDKWPVFVKVHRSHEAASIRTWQIFVTMPVVPATVTAMPFSQQADILDRRNAKGHLMFPHLRTALTTRWGRYAWENPSSFSLDNHLVVGSALFRGRIVNDWNIQVRAYSRCLWGQDTTVLHICTCPCIATFEVCQWEVPGSDPR
jgi:hypothetical protein